MSQPNRAPDWDWWRPVPTVTLYEGVALSLDINPDQLRRANTNAIMAGRRYAEGPEFERRLALAKRCLGETLPGPLNRMAVDYYDEDPKVRLRDFAVWAHSISWHMPIELARLALGDKQSGQIAEPNPNERLTLPEQVSLLAQIMPEDRARARIEKAFRFQEITYQPQYAFPYHDARIDWTSGVVTLRQTPRQPFIPTLTAAEFYRHFTPTGATVSSAVACALPHDAKTESEPEGIADGDERTHSGYPGRPSKSKHLIEDEFRRRIERTETLPILTDEAAALFAWFVQKYPQMPRPTPKTIENNIRDLHRQWKASRDQAETSS